jgi:catechol 2,3-dioxygenase-like lactoylglutathione lyase family enzyme
MLAHAAARVLRPAIEPLVMAPPESCCLLCTSRTLPRAREVRHHSSLVSKPTGSPIHHVALRVADPVASLAFYSGVLGLPEVRRFDEDGGVRSIWVRAGDAVLMLEREIKGSGPGAGSGHVLVLEVESLEKWVGILELAGRRPVERTGSTLYLSDPDGHRVGLSVFPRKQLITNEVAKP